MWKATFDANGYMIESQSERASDAVMLSNAERLGFVGVAVRVLSDAEHNFEIEKRKAR